MIKEIENLNDIKFLVDTFYSRVRQDDYIGPIFIEKIGDKWAEHLQKMYNFWETVLLDVHSYSGSPFPPHKNLPVNESHFDRWMFIFSATVDEFFTGQKAEEVKHRASQMAKMFNYKIEYFRNQSDN